MINCIQFNIGDKTYTFRDVNLKPGVTSLNEIVRELSKRSIFRATLSDLLSASEDNVQNINDILDYKSQDADMNTYIGDNAIGNLSPGGIAAMLTRTGMENANLVNSLIGSGLSKLDTYSYNFLVSDSVTKPEVFIGTARSFVALNPSHLKEPQTITRILSYLHADAAAPYPNNPLHKLILDYSDRLIKGAQGSSRVIRDLERWDDVNRVKRMLVYSQNPEIVTKYPILNDMLSDIGRYIASEVKDDTKVIATRSTEYQALDERLLNKDSVITLEDTKFSIKALLDFRRELLSYNSIEDGISKAKVAEELGTEVEYLPSKLEELSYILKSINDNDIAKAFFASSDPEILESVKNRGIVGAISEVIAKTIPKPSVMSEDTSYFIPKVESIKVDDSLEIGTKERVIIQQSNTLFGRDAIRLRVDTNQKTFFKKRNTRGNGAPEFIINPLLPMDISDETIKNDVETFTSKVTKGGNKKKVGIRNTIFVTTEPEYVSSPQAVQGIASFLKRINLDKSRVWGIQTTAYDALGLDIIKAARQASISVQAFPGVYNWKMDGFKKPDKEKFVKELEKLELPISNAMSSISYSFNANFAEQMNPELEAAGNVSQFNLLKMGKIDTLPIRDNNDLAGKEAGDVVTLVDDKSGYEYKMEVKGISDFKFRSKLNKWTDFFDNGQYKLGTVFNIEGKEMMLLDFTDDNKFVMTDGTRTTIVDHLSNKVGGLTNYPLYLSESKFIGDDTIYYNNIGLIGEDGMKKIAVSDFYTYFDAEIQEFSKRSGYTTEAIKNGILKNPSDFKKYRMIQLGKYSPSKYNLTSTVPPNYSNKNMLEILARKVTNAGVAVRMLPTTEIEKIGNGLSKHKAFIYNGEIILNEDLATEDSLMHELTHLLLGDLKANNYRAYKELLDESSKLSNFESLREAYKELSPYDYAEEVLVHNFAEYFMGRLRDWDNFAKVADGIKWRSLFSSLLKLEQPIGYSESDADILKKTLSNMLVNNNSSLLNQLNLGYSPTAAFVDRQVSNIKSQLIKNADVSNANKLEIICK